MTADCATSLHPLATIWDSTPLFETLDAIDIAAPSASHRAAVEAFAKGAEHSLGRHVEMTQGLLPIQAIGGHAHLV